MKKIVVLDAQTLGNDLDLGVLNDFGETEIYDNTQPHETAERIRNADIVISNKVVLDRETIMLAPKLKLICIAATGMNNVDLDAAAGMGIAVKNVSGYSTSSVVQHTFALLFSLMEQIGYYDKYVKKGVWSESGVFTHLGHPFFELEAKSWGIIGLGNIGLKVAETASAFGALPCYFSASGNTHNANYKHMELEEMMSTCDIVSIHSPLNDYTKDLIGSNELKLMKDRAILLNLGRGGIVDESALAKELDKREIYAGLDVCSKEPLPKDSPLLSLKYPQRVIITPHIAWTSIESRKRLLDGIVKNIEEFTE